MKREKEEMLKNKNKIGQFRAFYFICVFRLFFFLNNSIKEKKMKTIDIARKKINKKTRKTKRKKNQNRGDFLEESIRKLKHVKCRRGTFVVGGTREKVALNFETLPSKSKTKSSAIYAIL